MRINFFLVALVTPPDVLRAELVGEALKRVALDTKAIVDCLAFLNEKARTAVMAAIGEQSDGQSYAQLVEAKVGNKHLRYALLALGQPRDRSLSAAEDAAKLYAAGEKKLLGTDTNAFCDVILRSTDAHLREVVAAYPAASLKKHLSLAEAIKKEINLPHEAALKRVLLSRVRSEVEHFARDGEKALRGLNDDDAIVRLIALNTPKQLAAIEAKYSELFAGRNMLDDMSDQTSGWYGKFVARRLSKN